ncbi:hypothetical protein DM860_006107 [Cuscuta australis]|uniref:Protein kinase domain-containing protein n=1 Tax=Cuscuta australis TaxID=267555 RepID=A0A328DPN3_9ASTE|nr:hypothetical protein DM860_006107 [Cuscuta australis]
MSEDMMLQFSSNSSNQSDNSKMAKLEARMVRKLVAPQPISWSASSKFGDAESLPEPMVSSDSDDDDNGGEFLIQANTLKRHKPDKDTNSIAYKNVEGVADTVKKSIEITDTSKVGSEAIRKRQNRSKGNPTTGRGRGPRSGDQTKMLMVSPSNGQPENSMHMDIRPKEPRGIDDQAPAEDINSLRAMVTTLEEELKKSRQNAVDYQNTCKELEKELKALKDIEGQMKPKRMQIITDLLISVSKAERKEARMKVSEDSVRFGKVGVMRAGTVISEAWEEGKVLKDLNMQLRNLLELKEAIERQRRSMKKRQSDKSDIVDSEAGSQEQYLLFQDEIYKSRLANIKREEETIMRERDRYELEKGKLMREMKRIRDEDGSRFNNFQILNQRYALLNLLGKGGFSEVYKAFDLMEYRYVACKLHGLNAQWSEEKKQSYIRHAIREYNIHKTLVHNHIVRLWDIFEIDQNTFCTVLEYCSGKDLDAVLKATPVLSEKDARIIIIQIFHGLVYLNKRPQKIIHYDLKPGNVLFDELGIAKMTDFGLSKIVEDDVGSQGMELTSQGAGTYWYLPPECFELSKTPFISSKVDVWSTGILLYQMLFGRRPFGHDQTQERILREDTIIKARKVEFPSKPSVSSDAKDFIRRCLTYNQAERPDVLTIAQDPYLMYPKK